MGKYLWAASLLFSIGGPAIAQEAGPAVPLKCDTGPSRKTFGGTDWIVYSCDDRASMVVVSAKGNPASPFVFFLKREAGSYRVSGEGNGDKKASDAAGDALSKLTRTELEDLLASTNAASSALTPSS